MTRTVGSFIPNRGFLYEYEMNVNVFDREVVAAIRHRVVSNLLGFEQTPERSRDWIQLLQDVLDWNEWIEDSWRAEGFDISLNGAPLPEEMTPVGFAYPLYFGAPSACSLEGIGADITHQ